MSTHLIRRLLSAVVAVLDAAVLRVAWVAPTQLSGHLAHPRRWVGVVGSDTATLELARVGLWLTAAWLALAVIAVLACDLPGRLGRMADAAAGHAVPAVLRRVIATALGASVVLVPVAAGASTTGGHGGSTAATTSAAPASGDVSGVGARLSRGWPWSTSGSASTGTTNPTSGSAAPTPAKPVPWPHSSTPAPSTPVPTKRGPNSGDVIVRPGDCLWAIAAHRLGPHASTHHIAAETQRWYAANAATIGADAGLIHPGQHLHQPTEKGR